MLLARCLTTITISCCLISCGAGKQLPAPAWYQHPSPIDTGLLSFDGYYTIDNDPRYPLDRYHALTPVFITDKNNIWISHGAYTLTDSSLFTCKYVNKKDLGKYRTEGNKITAFLPVVVALGEGALYRTFHLHFSGTMVDKEIISDWKAIPPFPKRIKRRDIEFNNSLFKAHELKFIKTGINCLNR
jgi:hypothetical protein